MPTDSISPSLIDPNPWQTRRSTPDPVAIEALARSIAQDGLQNPPKVRPANGRYQLVYGHNRTAAWQWLTDHPDPLWPFHLAMMPVIVEEVTDEQMQRLAITENAQRMDTTPIEDAHAIVQAQTVLGLDMPGLVLLFGKSESWIRARRRLLDLPQDWQDQMQAGTLSPTTATTLSIYVRIGQKKDADSLIREYLGRDPSGITLAEHLANALNYSLRAEAKVLASSGYTDKKGNDFFSFEKAVTIKDSLRWTPKTLKAKYFPKLDLELIKRAMEHAYAGIDMIAQPWLFEPEMSMTDVELMQVLCAPPACNRCPYNILVAGTRYCTMSRCFRRKKDSSLANQFAAWMKKHPEASEWKLKNDGNNYIVLTGGYSSSKMSEVEKVLGEPFRWDHPRIRTRPRWSQYGDFPASDNKYVQVLIMAPEKKAGKTQAQIDAEQRLKRQQEEERAEILRKATKKFYRETFAPMLLSAVKTDSLPFLELMIGKSARDAFSELGLAKEFEKASSSRKLQVLFLRQLIVKLGYAVDYSVGHKGPAACLDDFLKVAKSINVDIDVPTFTAMLNEAQPQFDDKPRKARKKKDAKPEPDGSERTVEEKLVELNDPEDFNDDDLDDEDGFDPEMQDENADDHEQFEED